MGADDCDEVFVRLIKTELLKDKRSANSSSYEVFPPLT